jgi:F-type H+-transporting ATPase subunit delta
MRADRRTKRAGRALFRFCMVGDALDTARAREVARLLAASGAYGASGVLSEFARFVRLETARRTAIVESAAPLPARTRSDIQQRIALTYGPSSVVTFSQNASLIGGVRVRVGSHVYDSSVRARLSALEAEFFESAAK